MSNSIPEGSPPSRWIAPVGLVLALIAVALAVWSLLRPTSGPSAATSATSTQEQAKAATCKAYSLVSQAVSLQTHQDLGPEPVTQAAVAANARLAMFGGGTYLVTHLDPATPAELAAAGRSFATDLQDIAMYALAGVPNIDATQSARLRDAETASKRVAELCK